MYKIQYLELARKDLKKLDRPEARRVAKNIRKKLEKSPQKFGKPLSGNLKGLFRLRVGQNRVVYTILDGKLIILIVSIGMRRDYEVYKDAAKRFALIQDIRDLEKD